MAPQNEVIFLPFWRGFVCVCARVFLDVHVRMCVYTMEPLNAQCVIIHQLNVYQLVVVQRFDPST